MDKINEMDKLQRQDHDTLIRLEGKVDSLIITVATLQSGLDGRIKEIERQLDANTQWIHDFKNAYRIVAILGSTIGSLMGAVVTLISIKAEIFK